MSDQPRIGEPLTQQLQLQHVKPAPPTPEEALAEARKHFSPVGGAHKPVSKPKTQKPRENGDKNCGQGDSYSSSPNPQTPCKEESTMSDQAPQTSGFAIPQPSPARPPSGLSDQDRREISQMIGWLASNAKPAEPKKPGYFQKFDGVTVGEKLVTATGYGVITVGTFASCCGIAKLMGVVK